MYSPAYIELHPTNETDVTFSPFLFCLFFLALSFRPAGKLVAEEKREEGQVKATTYMYYVEAAGGIPGALLIATFLLLSTGSTIGTSR